MAVYSAARESASSGHDDFTGIWLEACRRYQTTTGKPLVGASLPRNTEQLVSDIDADNNAFASFRERSRTFFDVLDGIGRPLQAFSDLAGGAASSGFPPAASLFGAIKVLVGAADGVSASLDALYELLRAQRDFVVRFSIYLGDDSSQDALTPSLRTKVIEILVTVLDITAVATKTISEGRLSRFKSFGKNVLLGQDTKTQGLLRKLDRLTVSEHQLVAAENYAQTRQLSGNVKGMHSEVQHNTAQLGRLDSRVVQLLETIEADRDAHMEQQDNRLTEHIKSVLRPLPFSQDRHEAIKRERIQHVGDWIHQEQPITDWLKGHIKYLWMTGTAGCGKSFLAAKVYDLLRQQLLEGTEFSKGFRIVSPAIFFFQDNKDSTKSLSQALRDVAYQISRQDVAYSKYLASRCQSVDDIASLESTWRKLFLDYYDAAGNHRDAAVYILLDALDETDPEERAMFFDFVANLRENQDCNIHIAMLGRLHVEQEIDNAIGALPSVHINWTKNTEDITSYVKTCIKRSRILNRLSNPTKELIEQNLTSKAGGMFMWAKLMIAELTQAAKAGRESAIKQALNKAPRGLTPMLHHILQGYCSILSEEEVEDLNEMLGWVLFAKRPLTLGELDHVLRLRCNDNEPIAGLEEKLRVHFGSLFSLLREDGLTTSELLAAQYAQDSPTQEEPGDISDTLDDLSLPYSSNFNSPPATTYVSFAHASISDHLLQHSISNNIDYGSPRKIIVGVELDRMHCKITQVCLKVLETMSNSHDNSPQSENALPVNGLQGYVASQWYRHLVASNTPLLDKTSQFDMVNKLAVLLTKDEYLSTWTTKSTLETYSMENASKLLKILSNGEEHLPESLRAWAGSRASNVITTFEPAVNQLARCTLVGKPVAPPRSDLLKFMQIICAYVMLQNGGHFHQVSQRWTAEQVVAAAEWAQLEQNAKWHGQLGVILMDNNMHEPAKMQFEHAVEKAPHSASCKWKLAWSCVVLGELARGLELLKNLENDSFEGLNDREKDRIIFNSYLLLGQCYGQMSNTKNTQGKCEEAREAELQAIKILRKAALFPGSPDTNSLGFYALTANRRARTAEAKALCNPQRSSSDDAFLIYNEIMDTLRQLSSIREEGYHETERNLNCSKLAAYMRRDHADAFFIGASSAAYKTGSLDWLAEQYEVAIATAKRDMQLAVATDLGLNLATLYSYMPHKHVEAMDLWSKICANLRTLPALYKQTSRSRRSVVNAIGQFCLNRALESDMATSSQYIAILERLVEVQSEDSHSQMDVSCFQPRLMESCLARWHFNQGNTERAFDILRSSVSEALAILSDDDPENDWIGFAIFASISAAVQDDSNHVAAQHAAFGMPWDSIRRLCCNGCFTTFKAEDKIYRCRICMTVEFCESCHGILMAGKLSLYPTDICNASHKFFVQPPMPEMRSVELGHIFIDGGQITVEEWKSQVQKKWGL
ncbi:hypothetical protein K431DRAFT_54383 [Polychaeton citri CBS 116435]|uniref:Fungal STAND N-terminal Goodbye domain-containing protein n=1 Tax=Polychaeton citri CBS 116435 TaxID=1314669 RepID=A0A9P4QG86_9PEZI|nr:hypothetical protein K431DRAFT_54383 [Polychaeton citri CBS 116435]